MSILGQFRALAGLKNGKDDGGDDGADELRQSGEEVENAQVDSGQLACRARRLLVEVMVEMQHLGVGRLRLKPLGRMRETAVEVPIGGVGGSDPVDLHAHKSKGSPARQRPWSGGSLVIGTLD